MKKIGVIIGRFQDRYLHEGHINLFNAVNERSDEVILLIGSGVSKLTNRNPLDYKSRELMVKSTFPDAKVASIRDFKLNEEWSKNVDTTILSLVGEEINEITIYGCRDSFISYYSGTFNTVELLMHEIPDVSATKNRKKICENPIDSIDFRAGIIYAVGNKYPTTYPTVDIAVINGNKILLGRKEFEKEFRFIGGFVDPTDLSLEDAAARETREEIGSDVIIKKFEYISSRKIDDWRYKGTTDGIMTTFFKAHYDSGEPIASDDIFEVKWMKISDIKENDIVSEHYQLLQDLKK